MLYFDLRGRRRRLFIREMTTEDVPQSGTRLGGYIALTWAGADAPQFRLPRVRHPVPRSRMPRVFDHTLSILPTTLEPTAMR